MLARRVIVCLDVQGGRVVKGVGFRNLRDVGDPAELATRYEEGGADEIVFLDIGASSEERGTILDVVRKTAEALFVPLTLGGGVRTAEDVGLALRSGADKVAMNSAAIARPALLTDAAHRFGSQCVVASIDARHDGTGWKVWSHGASVATDLDAVEWAQECVERGAGEILLTSIDRDGARSGYDIELTRAVANAVTAPVIASGGAGHPGHCRDAIVDGNADAVLVAGIVHDGLHSVSSIKHVLAESGIQVR